MLSVKTILKEKLIHSLLLLSLYLFTYSLTVGQNNPDVMIQGFNWPSHSNTSGWYNVVSANAADMANSGIDVIWMPPPSNAAAPQGYLPRELYDLNSQYGTQAELTSCINNLHAQGMEVLADIVINHRVGSFGWADFMNPTWGCWAVTAGDEWGQNGGNPCGGNDTGDNYHAARDIDHTNSTVRNDLSAWMNWLKNTIGFDGWRYDYVRGFAPYYCGYYNDQTGGAFSVGELWNGLDINNVNPHRQEIVNWIDGTSGKSHAFDFTTKGVLQAAVNNEYWRLSINGAPPGVIGWYPSRSVTFVDNHDTGSTQGYWPFPGNKVMQGYAYILTHPGIPCVFWDHFYDWGLKNEIADIIDIRKRNGLHSTSVVEIKAAQGNLYAAEIDGVVAMKIGPGNWSPSGSGWNLAASGNDYAIWEKGSSCTGNGLTIHFKKPAGWNSATMYFWNTTPASSTSTSWPGVQMTAEGGGWYAYTIPCSDCASIIFSDNGSNQTANLSRCGEGWYDGSWHSSNPDVGGGDLVVHFRPTSYNNPEIYFWNVTPTGQSTSWPGVSMTSEGNGWYGYTFSGASCANFIFSNNGGSQSPDLSSCSEVWITEGQWPSKTAATALEELAVKVFPVPADQMVTLRIEGSAQVDQLDIYDASGRKIKSLPGQSLYELEISDLAEGMYIYRVLANEQVLSGRFPVQH